MKSTGGFGAFAVHPKMLSGGTLNDGSGLKMVRVLGPVDVVMADGPTIPGGRLERTLFAALALSTNRAVSRDQLSHILWGDSPPSSRDNTLQTYVSRLRHLLGHERIRSEDHSYVLDLTRTEIDAILFEDTVTRAAAAVSDPERCLALCTEALGLWRGVPFGELADHDPFRLEAIRLDEIRQFVVELRLASQISIGREEMVVGSLTALADEYPYRERIWFLLIAALALCGRRTEALRAYYDLHQRLAEVGLAPIAEIRALETAILDEVDDLRAHVPRLFDHHLASTGEDA
jgi:DNA-binding SARP family transcriptional activator